jgi:hypothetical protein
MIQEAWDTIAEVDRLGLALEPSLELLRQMTLDEFGELLLTLPNSKIPHLSKLLPANTPNAVQERWTGSSGITLLRQSISFLNFVSVNYQNHTGRLLSSSRILDFGCGWGRLMRLMSYFVDSANLYGCDAWESSLNYVRQARVAGSIARSAVQLDELPFRDVEFDLIYAFSVFTHLPKSLMLKYLQTFRRSIADRGLVIITIRPLEFWEYIGKDRGHCQVKRLQNELALVIPVRPASSHLLDRRLLSPDLERFCPGTPIADSTEAMTPWPEVAVDDGVCREKVLRLGG